MSCMGDFQSTWIFWARVVQVVHPDRGYAGMKTRVTTANYYEFGQVFCVCFVNKCWPIQASCFVGKCFMPFARLDAILDQSRQRNHVK